MSKMCVQALRDNPASPAGVPVDEAVDYLQRSVEACAHDRDRPDSDLETASRDEIQDTLMTLADGTPRAAVAVDILRRVRERWLQLNQQAVNRMLADGRAATGAGGAIA
jgi:hypothetical protein